MTPAEAKALRFLAGLAVLGGVARGWAGASERVPPSAAERAALDAQLAAVDSARDASAAAKRSGRRRGARGARGGTERRAGRADTAGRWPAAVAGAGAVPAGRAVPEAAGPVDLDRADSAALEALPGIGPALAGRIVAERAARGPFGTVRALDARVRGVGPALAARLAPLVAQPP